MNTFSFLLTATNNSSQIKIPAAGVFITFTVCIACFPGVATSMKSKELGDWYPVLAVLCYNTADLVGKSLPGFWQPFDGTTVIIPVLLNVCVLPIMVLEKHFDGSGQGGPVVSVLQSTAVRFATTSLLGILTGFSATCCLMVAPSLAPKKYSEVAAQMMSVFLIFGLFAGSILGALLPILDVGDYNAARDVPYPVINPGGSR